MWLTKILAVAFEVDAQKNRDVQLSIPKEICDIHGLREEDDVHLVFEVSSGKQETRIKQLKSGAEIYDSEENLAFAKAGN
jgi:hypothetical protein